MPSPESAPRRPKTLTLSDVGTSCAEIHHASRFSLLVEGTEIEIEPVLSCLQLRYVSEQQDGNLVRRPSASGSDESTTPSPASGVARSVEIAALSDNDGTNPALRVRYRRISG